LKTPLIKKNGELVPATWDEAYDYIANELTRIKNDFGPDYIAGISSARARTRKITSCKNLCVQ
jgi:formate dehydrogenase major subunit